MNKRRVQYTLLAAALSVLVGCPADTLKELVEDKFPDFTGLDTALNREYIVGLQPDTGFPNLHCCWVGDRTGWQKIQGSWTTEERVEVDADVLGILKAFTIEISAKTVSYVEATAEPFYRDQLLNIRHFLQAHCPRHPESCAKKICVDSLKVGEVKVTTYTELGGGVDVGLVKALTEKNQAIKLGGKTYTKDTTTAKDIIVGYKMAPTECGPLGTWVRLGEDNTPSGNPKQGETYEQHAERFRRDIEKLNNAHSYVPREPSAMASIQPLPSSPPSMVLAPPQGAVIAGQVIRVTTADAAYNPHPHVTGVVVTEADASGRRERRTVATDAGGGAWIAVGANVATLAVSLGPREVYATSVQPHPATPPAQPVIDDIQPFRGQAPVRMIESGGLAEIRGTGLHEVTEVSVDGRPTTPLASGTNYVVASLDGEGPAQVQVACANGFSSPPATVTLVKITPAQIPPSTLAKGQTADLVLRITGTSEAVPVALQIQSPTIQFADGGKQLRAISSGGTSNMVRTTIRASRPGPYDLTYRLTR